MTILLSNFLTVFIGGGSGAVLRFISSLLVSNITKHLWLGTLFVNLLGCLIYYVSYRYVPTDKLNIYLVRLGFCGALTTFSTFSFESIQLFQSGRIVEGIFSIILNVFLGITFGLLIL